MGYNAPAMIPFEEIEHDADVALRVRGASRSELFAHAAEGMIGLMVDPATVAGRMSLEVCARGGDDESLLVAWLDEILFALDGEGFVPQRAEVDAVEDGAVCGRLWGEPLDEGRHELRAAIKAVTWHGLDVRRTDDGYEVVVIFDV